MIPMKSLKIICMLVLILVSSGVSAACWTEEAYDLSYQIGESDRIAAGNVTDIRHFGDYDLVTIAVDEWMMNPLPCKNITVKTDIQYSTAATFTENESVVLMLQDMNVSGNMFTVAIGEPGKHPISEKGKIYEKLGGSGQVQEEQNNTGNTPSSASLFTVIRAAIMGLVA
jgi:hypothetical protein